MDNDTPYVAFMENLGFNSYVKKYNGTTWEVVGTGYINNTNESGNYPSLDIYNGTPYVTYSGKSLAMLNNRIYVKRLNGTSWEQIGSVLNVDINRDALHPKISAAAYSN